MVERHHITGLILAGGRSSRFAGHDSAAEAINKGLALLDGQPLVAHVQRYMAERVGPLWISANRHPSDYRRYGQVVPDDPVYGKYAGPLAGVATALKCVQTPWLLTLPVDTPCLPDDLVTRLADRAAQGALLVSASTEHGAFPLCMLVHRTLAMSLHNALLAGQRKVRAWQADVGGVDVVFNAFGHAFFNINTVYDLERLRGDSQTGEHVKT
ncbi:MAG: molybdenum cofactor guanylyltransferase MobA [Pusillimonas sp.]